MIDATGQQQSSLCIVLFTGDYPIELPDESLLGKHLLEAMLKPSTHGEASSCFNNP